MALVPTFQKLNLLLSKEQAAQGTKETLVYTDFVTVDDTFELNYTKERAEQSLVQGIFGKPQTVGGLSMVDVKVSLPIIPTGSATLPNVDSFLSCCGMAYTLATYKHSYTPFGADPTDDWKDMTLWSYTGDKTAGDSIVTKAHSVMFDFEMAGELGKPVIMTFTGKGVPDGVPAAATYPADAVSVLSAVPPAMLKNATMTINGLTFCLLNFSVKGGNDVQLIKCTSDASGHLQAMITGVKSEWSASVYMADASTNNPQSLMAAGTLGTTTIQFGNAADSLISVVSGSNKSELLTVVQGNDNGLMTWDITGSFVDNDYTISIND